ncbi:MAG: Bacterial membrane protein YfhO [Firmicutes bacterium ADurb.Bin300]|nr:MAG: Bacterial membrane protein YfhO [Firmicutes bacterium ADurb.Bin300]
MKLKINHKRLFLVAPLITIIWLLVIYFIKDIYPFGSGTIIDYDLYQGGVPAMYYVYDALHSGSFFYDFTTAGGFGRDSLLSLFSLDNLFLFFFSRDMLINAISLLLIIKLAFISFTASYSFSKIFEKLPIPWVILLSLIFTFSGYNMQYFTNTGWLDAVALYPLIILFTLNLFKGKSKIPYLVVLSYLLIFNTYMAFFVVLSLIVFGGLYVFIVAGKSKLGKNTYALGVATIASLLASGCSLYRNFSSIFGTARFDMIGLGAEGEAAESSSYSVIWDLLGSSNNLEISSLFMLLGVEFAIACLILMWFNFRKNKNSRKYTVYFTLVFAALLLQIFVKGVNLLWHGGSYVCFPFRNGYMLTFFGCCIIGYFIIGFDLSYNSKYKVKILNLIIPILCTFSFVFIVPYILTLYQTLENFNVLSDNGTLKTGILMFPYGMMLLALTAGFLLFRVITNRNFRTVLTCALLILPLGVLSFRLVGNAEGSERTETYNQYYEDCFDVRENVTGNNEFERVCNPDLALITNYPYISGVPSLSNWTHSLSSNHIHAFVRMGFSSVYTRILDSGGTVFSKALLRITDTVSKSKLNNKLYYETRLSQGGYHYYSAKYILPVGLLFNENITKLSFEDFSNCFEYQNAVYNSLTGDSDLFIKTTPEIKDEKYSVNGKDYFGNKSDEENICKLTTSIRISNDSVVYLQLYRGEENKCFIRDITVNGKKLIVPNASKNYGKNTRFPVGFNNNILEIGCFGNEVVELVFNIVNGNAKNPVLYSMDLQKMQTLCENSVKNDYKVSSDSISLSVSSVSDNKILFIPLTYEDEWECTVNGEPTKPVCILNNFIGIKADKGENNIQLTYSHRSVYLNAVLTALCFFLAAALLSAENKLKRVPKFVTSLMSIAFVSIFIVTAVVLYLVPVLYFAFALGYGAY